MPREALDTAVDLVTIDTNTGLMWAADGDENGCDGGMTGKWVPALQTCYDLLNFAGFNDWRLPNVNELSSLVNFKKHDPATDFPDMPSKWFWSSSLYAGDSSYAWYVDFKSGYVGWYVASGRPCARCVRP